MEESKKELLMIIASDGTSVVVSGAEIPVTLLYKEGDGYACEMIEGERIDGERLQEIINEALGDNDDAEDMTE